MLTWGGFAEGMSENDALYAIRHADGSVSLYIDEEYAAERGVDPATLTRVEIPRELFSTGTVQQLREYVARLLGISTNRHRLKSTTYDNHNRPLCFAAHS